MLGELKVDKIFKRKCENTGQTSSTQSYEKRQKIYHQHYDHSYAKKMIMIDFINDDCLMKIFMYIPVCERPKVAQVCKNWNRVVHSYCFKVNKLVLSHWEYDCPQNSLEQFKTNEKKLSFLRSLLDKCCNYLIELDLVAYDNSNIVPIVNKSCPNLEKLRLRLKYPFDNNDLENAFSRMSKLKILKIIFQRTPKIPKTLILSLKNVANTLNELILLSQSEDTLTLSQFPNSFLGVIPQLKALKKFEIGGIWITFSILDALEAIDDRVDFYHHGPIYGNLDKNLKLVNITYLIIPKDEKLTDDILYNIANSFKFLESLDGNSSSVTDVGIQAITKMKHLKNLNLTGKNYVTDSQLKLLKGLITLELPDSYNITNKSVEKIIENSPYMEELWFKNTSITPGFIKTAQELSEKRKIFLKLYVHFSNWCVGRTKTEYSIVRCLCCVRKN